jgi:hypothetical protein
MPARKYEVRGEDVLGDVHCFHTDDRERAKEVAALLREEIGIVELIEHSVAEVPVGILLQNA